MDCFAALAMTERPLTPSIATDSIFKQLYQPSLRALAKQSMAQQADRWIASRSLSSGAHSRDPLARNDGGHTFAFPRRDPPEVCQENSLPSTKKRAQGKPDARCTRGLVCKIVQKNAHTSIQVQRRQSDFPCAMVLTVYGALSPVIGLV
jgi:hypothetical protein